MLRRQFEWALGEAQQGRGRAHLSLNSDVKDVLLEIMDATLVVSADRIAAAQSAFADQLAGGTVEARRAVQTRTNGD
ncbi:hypothetical protein ACFVJ5_27200 [Nocardia sp. NPDC127606]|uniref:hypothetical protein n=1 Tax=Nocardia sp. NPDC127606 TaxID=3345406 RepID=UPI003628A410